MRPAAAILASVRFLTSAHASHEELFLLKQMSEGMKGEGGADHVHVTWRRSEKRQPADTKFRVPATDAPNVNGARDLGLTSADRQRRRRPTSRPCAPPSSKGTVEVLYVVDPGPDGSLGDVSWLARRQRRPAGWRC